MKRKVLWLAVSGLMALSLVIAACGPAQTTPTTPATPTAPTTPTTPTTPTQEKPQQETVKPTGEAPKYGGTLNLALASDPTNWDPVRVITGFQYDLTHQTLLQGDWTKGPAGGYGTNEIDWGFANNDIWHLRTGFLAESEEWSLDAATGQGTIVFKIRQGIHWQKPDTEAGRLVNGREMTADDVVFSLRRATTIGSTGFIWRVAPDLRDANITKTGPWEVTIKAPSADVLLAGIVRFATYIFIVNPEVVNKYGDLQNTKNFVGTGPFMLTEYIPGSVIKLIRNPNYWQKDPIGPGKGNQLPYLNGVRILVIPDASTRQAALRTAKVDWMSNISSTDAPGIKKTAPALLETVSTSLEGRGTPLQMRTDKAPFNDIRVRKAMMLATDFQTILDSLYGGVGQIVTNPFSKVRGYEKLYCGLEDPDFPEAARELYSYNPEKARQLLKEAGYPNGFKTKIMLNSSDTTSIDYYAIIKDMWAKVGIELEFDLKDTGSFINIANARTHEALVPFDTGPVGPFYNAVQYLGRGAQNLSMIDDPVINAAMKKLRLACLTDLDEGMRIFREEVFKHAVQQVYVIPNVIGPNYLFWWPWLKNYSGEQKIGFDCMTWPQYIWYDQDLKKSMGY